MCVFFNTLLKCISSLYLVRVRSVNENGLDLYKNCFTSGVFWPILCGRGQRLTARVLDEHLSE